MLSWRNLFRSAVKKLDWGLERMPRGRSSSDTKQIAALNAWSAGGSKASVLKGALKAYRGEKREYIRLHRPSALRSLRIHLKPDTVDGQS